GVRAQPRLGEASGGMRAPRDSVLLSCRGSGCSFVRYAVGWYRQTPNGRFELVSNCWASGNPYYGAVEQGRARVSQDNSQSVSYPSLHALHSLDTTGYFCAL
ncbi:Ig heavy chain V region 914, partial [Chaetura pelagica]